MDKTTEYARACGKCPDRFWAQLNGKSAKENFAEQRERFYADLLDQDDDDPDDEIHFVSEVRIK